MSPRFDTALRWLLVASLALNVGLLSGIAWKYLDRDDPPQRKLVRVTRGAMMPSPHLLRRALPEERRAVVDAVLAEHHDRIHASVGAVFEARTRVHALVTAETLDRPALDQAFADLRARDAEAAIAVQAMLTELVTELTPEERRALGEAVHRHHPRLRRDRDAPAPR
jgi:uncharacterized membrane protein